MVSMILNLTQHLTTPEQRAAGVVELPDPLRARVADWLTFDALPTAAEIAERAAALADLASRLQDPEDRAGVGIDLESSAFAPYALIGGAPWLMAPLEAALRDVGLVPVYAFSARESVEETLPDGTVHKRTCFRHKGFVVPDEAENTRLVGDGE